MPLSDSSQTCARAVRPKPSPAVLRLTFAAGISEVSRFSCMKFLGVPGAFDYAGPTRARAIAIVRVAFRTCLLRRRPGCIFSQLNLPPRLFPCLRFAVHLAMPNAKLGAKVDRYSFFVRLLPPLLHTGLARRTNIPITLKTPRSRSEPLDERNRLISTAEVCRRRTEGQHLLLRFISVE